MTTQPRVLVLRGGAIGDLVVTLPVLSALRARWPDAYVELLGYPHVARLALSGGLVNKVASLDQAGIARFFALKPRFTEAQVDYVRSFDLIISFLHDPDGSVSTNLGLAGAKQVVYGSPIVTEGHAVEHLMKPLESLAIYAENEVPRLFVSDAEREHGRALLCGLRVTEALAIHPGSGSPKKNWPTIKFISVARRFPGRAFFIVGEADGAIDEELRVKAPDVPVLAGKTLPEVAAALSACSLYLGNDSGITHLAAAVGLPVIALFGPSEPARWGPRGPKVTLLRGPGGNLDALEVNAVVKAIL